jgi:hypothetical protein
MQAAFSYAAPREGSMELGAMIGGLTSAAMVLSVGLWVGMVVYIVARWRTYREAGAPDPQLGLKTAIGMFLTVSYQAMLAGAFLLLGSLLTTYDDRGGQVRLAFGVLVPAALVFGAHWVALARTNAAELPLVPRMFAGVSLIITGGAGFVTLLMFFVTLFERGEGGEGLRKAMSGVLVYSLAWVLQGMKFIARVSTGAPPAGVQQYARPVPPPAVPPPS